MCTYRRLEFMTFFYLFIGVSQYIENKNSDKKHGKLKIKKLILLKTQLTQPNLTHPNSSQHRGKNIQQYNRNITVIINRQNYIPYQKNKRNFSELQNNC